MTLRELREQRAMSQAEVARELQVSTNAYNKWERGLARPQNANIRAISKLYGLTPAEVQRAINETEREQAS